MSDSAELHSIQGSKITDEERSAKIRAELRPVLEKACEIITSARREGLNIGFNLMADAYGVQRVGNIDIFKGL